MSTMKQAILGLCLLSSSVLADEIVMTMELNGSDYYGIQKNNITGTRSVIDGKFSLVGSLTYGGKVQHLNFSQDIPSTQGKNTTNLIIKSKNSLQIVNSEHGIDGVAEASISKKLFGALKTIEIKERDYLAVMQPVLEASGYNQLKALELGTDELKFKSNIASSDYKCSALNKEELKCDSSVVIEITVSDQASVDLSNCSFSSREAAIHYVRAMKGSTTSVDALSESDLNQDASCSSAIYNAIDAGLSVAEIVNN